MFRRKLVTALATGILVALLAAVGALAAAPHKRAKYSGLTAQQHRLSFRVSRDGTNVTGFRTMIDYVCTGGVQAGGSFTSRDMAIHRGTFGETTAAHGTGGGYAVKSAVSSITGKFLPKGKASGTIRERATLFNGLKCDSGKVAFNLTASK